jgi:ACDE family multidrug resistance protein
MRHPLSNMFELGVHRSLRLQVIFGSSIMMIMGASLVYPVLPVIAESLDISEGNIGLVLTAFTLPAVFLTPVGGLLIDMRGRKQVLVASLLLYGVAGLSIAAVDSLAMLLTLRVVQGIAYAGVMPLVVVLIGDTFSKEQEITAQGVKVVLDRATLLVLPALAGSLALVAWQAPFVLYAAAIPLGLIAMRWLPEPPIAKRTHAPSYVKEVFVVALQVRSLTIFSMSSMRFFLEMSFFIYLPIFASRELDISIVRGGLLFTVFAMGSMTTASTIGAISVRFSHVPLVVVAFLIQAGVLAGASVADSVWVLGVLMFVFGVANGVISPVQKSLLTQSVPGELRGGFVAADRIAQNTAKSVAPLVAGAIVVATDIATMFQVMAVIAVAWAALASAATLLTVGRTSALPTRGGPEERG